MMVDLTGGTVSSRQEGASLSQKRPTWWSASSRQRRRTATRQGVSLSRCPATRQAMLVEVLVNSPQPGKDAVQLATMRLNS
jgi:hypothetical protein